jgi:alpha-D-ribose 1-methylphosphonate 5-triphosphate synthase subunit PhnL
MSAMLEVQGLTKRFRLHNQGGVVIEALADLDLSVAPGECVVLSGPSGSGKSTLLRCVYGNYSVETGRVLVRDGDERVDLAAAHPRRILALRRRTMGWVSQFLRVVPRVSALDIVAEPMLAAGILPEAARSRAAALLDRLAVPERLWNLAPQTFSGGEQQRVNLARGFALDYPLLLLDEPTAALDDDNRARVAGLIEDARVRGAALLGIVHDAAFARTIATRVVPLSPTRRRAA